ncbi:MAG: hypothetical protein GQ570_03485 [Helicobacteraceae bacterium]|nr:hypothetical protein [Helicobacteraceae bacterium]
MSVTMTKKKVVASKSQTIKDTLFEDLQGMVPELVKATTKVNGITAKLKIAKQDQAKATKPFLAHIEAMELDPDDKLLVNGEDDDIAVSSVPHSRQVIDNKAIFDLLESIQPNLAYELLSFKLTDIDKYLNPVQQDQVLEQTHKGARKLSVKPHA